MPPLQFDAAWVEEAASRIPELPAARRARYRTLGADAEQAALLAVSEPGLRDLFEGAVAAGAEAGTAANWTTGEVVAALRRAGDVPVSGTSLTAPRLAELLEMVGDDSLSSSAAREVLAGVMAGEGSPREVAEARDLLQVSDAGLLEEAVEREAAEHPEEWARLQAGEQKLVGFFVGRLMRRTGGKADPKLAARLIRARAGL